MRISAEEVEYIAKLARLELKPEEKEAFTRQLSSILEYVGQLQSVPTEGVTPMSHAVPLENVWAEDVVRPDNAAERQAVIADFPEKEGDLLKVKAVFS